MLSIIYSFDIFDTCLTRSFAQPQDLFMSLGKKVLSPGNKKSVSKEKIFELVRIRIEAEKYARQFSEQEDIDIYKIYEHISIPAWCRISKQEMLQEEMNLELRYIYPVAKVKKKIELLRTKGKIIFISDMYLPKKFLHEILSKYGFIKKDEYIFVSGEIGLTKRSGNLFKYVLKYLNIKAHQLCHYGDNSYSDKIIPKKIGIESHLILYSRLTRFEKQIVSENEKSIFYSKLAGISKVTRLSNDKIDNCLGNIISGVIAPLLISFVKWVINEANTTGIKKLYFVSRDGQILKKIADEFAKYRDTPQRYYLYGSRQAWYLPSLNIEKKGIKDWLIINGHSKSIKDMLAKLKIKPQSIKELLDIYGIKNFEKQLNDKEIKNFWKLINSKEFQNLVLKNAKQAYELCSKYFIQEKLYDDISFAFVDIGWTLKTQRAVKNILNSVNCKHKIIGYYLGVNKDRISMDESGLYKAFILQPPYWCNPAQKSECLFKYARVIEQVFTMANHNSVIGYKKEGKQIKPYLKNCSQDIKKQNFVKILHEIVIKYAQIFMQEEIDNQFDKNLKKLAIRNLDLFLTQPNKEEIEILSWIKLGDDQNESRQYRLAKKLELKDIFVLGKYAVNKFLNRNPDFPPQYAWLSGCINYSNFFYKYCFKIANSFYDLYKKQKR